MSAEGSSAPILEKNRQRLVLGIGPGRCGSLSLATLLNAQENATATHELRQPDSNMRIVPLLPWEVDNARLRSALTSLYELGTFIVGDVGHYWLPYLDDLFITEPEARIVALWREPAEVVASFLRKIDRPGGKANHWMEHDGMHWKRSALDVSFPKYRADGVEAALAQYCDDYYGEVDRLAQSFPARLKVFDMKAALNSRGGQLDLLQHLGIDGTDAVVQLGTHVNRSTRSLGQYLRIGLAKLRNHLVERPWK